MFLEYLSSGQSQQITMSTNLKVFGSKKTNVIIRIAPKKNEKKI
jgi:hypothetical protein